MAKESEKLAEEQQPKPCPKDCSKCSFYQQTFCAAQMSFYLVEKVNYMQNQMLSLEEEIKDLKSLVKSAEPLINPIDEINK